MPPSIIVHAVGDQSIFVRAAIFSVLREAVLAAGLVGLMILLFLGSWRSTMIIIVSIPLSILFSLTALSWLGETINIMTLGGLALAVGMLVDEGTVTLENIFYHLEQGKETEPAILDGAQQIVVPAFVTLLVLSIVFAPMFQLGGVAGYLFRPFAEAVVFALLASFILSRTLVPTMANYLLRGQGCTVGAMRVTARRGTPPLHPFVRAILLSVSRKASSITSLRSEAATGRYSRSPSAGPKPSLPDSSRACSCRSDWRRSSAENFFPTVEFRPDFHACPRPTGTRIEETARLCDLVEQAIRQIIPAGEMDNIVDNIGLPYSGINMAYSNSGTIGPAQMPTC